MPKHNVECKLIIDKAAVTLPMSDKQKDRVFNNLVEKKVYKKYNGRVYNDDSSYRYRNNYQLDIHDRNSADLSIYPFDPEHNFSRVEYNPTLLEAIGRTELRRALIDILGINVVKKIYYHAPITRLDITLDIFNMQRNLYIHCNRATHSEIYKVGRRIQSQVIGSERSDCRITMYDKNAERKSRGKANGAVSGNYQRIEIRLRNLRCTMHELSQSSDLIDRFAAINFFEDGFLDDERFSRSFVDRVSKHGLNKALSKLSRNKRERYRRYLADYQVFPISISQSDFTDACRRAFGCMVHRTYSAQFLGRAA